MGNDLNWPILDRLKTLKEKKGATLNMSIQKLTDEEAKSILNYIHKSKIKTLKYLDFSSNGLSQDFGHALAKFLKHDQAIEILGLSWNFLEESTIEIVEALKTHQSIRTVYINSNKIGDTGAIAFAELLTVNPRIERLNLFTNEITTPGASKLLEAMKVHRSLTELNIGNNVISEEILLLFKDEMEYNKNYQKNKILYVPVLMCRLRKDCVVSLLPRRVLLYILQFIGYVPKLETH